MKKTDIGMRRRGARRFDRGTALIGIFMGLLWLAAPLARAADVPLEAQRHLDKGRQIIEEGTDNSIFQRALWEYEKAVELAPSWPDAVYNKGVLEIKTGDIESASASLKRYLELAPHAKDAADVRQMIGDLEKELAARAARLKGMEGAWIDRELNLNYSGVVEGEEFVLETADAERNLRADFRGSVKGGQVWGGGMVEPMERDWKYCLPPRSSFSFTGTLSNQGRVLKLTFRRPVYVTTAFWWIFGGPDCAWNTEWPGTDQTVVLVKAGGDDETAALAAPDEDQSVVHQGGKKKRKGEKKKREPAAPRPGFGGLGYGHPDGFVFRRFDIEGSMAMLFASANAGLKNYWDSKGSGNPYSPDSLGLRLGGEVLIGLFPALSLGGYYSYNVIGPTCSAELPSGNGNQDEIQTMAQSFGGAARLNYFRWSDEYGGASLFSEMAMGPMTLSGGFAQTHADSSGNPTDFSREMWSASTMYNRYTFFGAQVEISAFALVLKAGYDHAVFDDITRTITKNSNPALEGTSGKLKDPVTGAPISLDFSGYTATLSMGVAF